MSALDDVRRIEAAFEITLPSDYAQFLVGHSDDFLELSLDFSIGECSPRGDTAWVDGLHTAAQIVENEERDSSCDAASQMLIIGYNLMGGYLYLCYSSTNSGQVFFREPYVASTYYPVAGSFREFLTISRPSTREA